MALGRVPLALTLWMPYPTAFYVLMQLSNEPRESHSNNVKVYRSGKQKTY